MKIHKKHGAVIIESKNIVKFSGWLMVGKHGAREAKAAAFFPFVFVRKEEYATPIFVNHERIHIRQQIQTLFIGSWILTIFEDLYSRMFMKLKAPDYYLYRSVEQEAYRNQHNLNYLNERRWFELFKYILDKKKLTFIPDKPPEVEIGDSW